MAKDQKPARVTAASSGDSRRANKPKRSTVKEEETPTSVRLNKYLSECGISSRRAADKLIDEGLVMVNGKKVYELGTKIDPSTDRITVKGKPVRPPNQKLYILFNKPRNVVTTMEDPEGRPTIADYFERLPVRVFPVGRLDWDTEGMILLTNDGEFAQKVNHPSEEIWKTYLVKVDGRPTDVHLERLRRGVTIQGGGKVAARGVERITKGDSDKYGWIKIMIAEGKNRQVRRMFEKIGFDVMKLQRVGIGRLRMPSKLERGEYLFLTEAGIAKIFQREPILAAKERARKTAPRSVKAEARTEASRKGNERRPAARSGRTGGARSGSTGGGRTGRGGR